MRKPGRSAAAIAAVPIALLVGVVIAAQFPGAAAGTPAAVVASIYDGDTLTLTNGQRVRLLQIDTPELGSGRVLLAGGTDGARPASANREQRQARSRSEARQGRSVRATPPVRPSRNDERERRAVRAGAAAPYFYGGEKGRYAGD
jgi:endonuclease YncB( thermonuclease family)